MKAEYIGKRIHPRYLYPLIKGHLKEKDLTNWEKRFVRDIIEDRYFQELIKNIPRDLRILRFPMALTVPRHETLPYMESYSFQKLLFFFCKKVRESEHNVWGAGN